MRAVAFCCGFALFLVAPIARAATFMGLGIAPDGIGSHAFAVSADGTTVVGRSQSTQPNGDRAFRWTSMTGMVDLGDLANENSEAHGVSADGSVVVGCGNGCGQAFLWTEETGLVDLGNLPGQVEDDARGVSADGSVIVGRSYDPGSEAFLWTADAGMLSLGAGQAYGVSADGSVVVGESSLGEAFRWTSATGMVGLGILADGDVSSARGVSADGSVVVGVSVSQLGMSEAFRWTSGGGMVGLGFLAGGDGSEAVAVSGDGSIIVGSASSSNDPQDDWQAFFWDSTHGMRSVREVLVNDFGLDLTGWILDGATGISADGNTIVGIGRNPGGEPEAWIAVIPEPTTGLLVIAGLLGLAGWRRRRA